MIRKLPWHPFKKQMWIESDHWSVNREVTREESFLHKQQAKWVAKDASRIKNELHMIRIISSKGRLDLEC